MYLCSDCGRVWGDIKPEHDCPECQCFVCPKCGGNSVGEVNDDDPREDR